MTREQLIATPLRIESLSSLEALLSRLIRPLPAADALGERGLEDTEWLRKRIADELGKWQESSLFATDAKGEKAPENIRSSVAEIHAIATRWLMRNDPFESRDNYKEAYDSLVVLGELLESSRLNKGALANNLRTTAQGAEALIGVNGQR